MDFSIKSEFLQTLIRITGLTLLHSLWQGVVLAALAGLVLLGTKKVNPMVRYNLLAGLFFLFVVSAAITFFLLFKKPGSPSLLQGPIISANPAYIAISNQPDIFSFPTRHAHTLALIWLLAVILKSIYLGKELYELHYLRTHQIYTIGAFWESQVAVLANQMGISRSIKVVQSGLVQAPMVMGHFKPIILVPLGVITAIPAEQIEMVLLHELAHIRRMDFFVNFLQHLSELIFFFNPALLWVSHLIRKERENCCDDMALQYSGNKVIYINALLSFREYQLTNAVYAMAFNKESGLVQRARRIASRTNTTLRLSEKIVLTLTVMMLFTFTILFARNSESKNGADVQQAQSFNKLIKQPEPRLIMPVFKKPTSALSSRRLYIADNEAFTTVKDQLHQDSLLKLNTSKLAAMTPMQADTLQPLSYEPGQIQLHPAYTLLREDHIDRSLDSSARPRLSLRPTILKYDADNRQTYKATYRDYEPAVRKNFHDQILEEIQRAGVVVSPDNILLHITNEELIINGIKQPAHVHKQVISKIIRQPGDKIDYTYGSTK